MAKIKALSVYVYRDELNKEEMNDGTNNGASKDAKEIYVAHPHGPYDIDEENPLLFKVVNVTKDYKCLEPYKECPKGYIGWMDGGNIGYSYDGRFREMSPYPLMIHDRKETPEDYNMLTR